LASFAVHRSQDALAASAVPAHAPADTGIARAALERTIDDARTAMRGRQQDDGHWVFALEADATIPSEYILYMHYVDAVDPAVQGRLAEYIRDTQEEHGGWALYYRGDANISATVKAYWALKLAGDDPEAEHMQQARAAVHRLGGAERANVLTRFWLALFGEIPWRGVPCMPVEAVLLPRWFPFHMHKISYWSRCTLLPMMVLMAVRPRAINPTGLGIGELFREAPERVRQYQINPTGARIGDAFLVLDKVLHTIDRFLPRRVRRMAINTVVDYVEKHINGVDGVGAIFPPMVFSIIMFRELGYPEDHPAAVLAREALRRLLLEQDGTSYLQPCWSPVWDTGLMLHAMLEAGEDPHGETIAKAVDWLKAREITDVVGDWEVWRPGLAPGGWAFQYENAHFPDVDDTAVVGMALDRIDPQANHESIKRTATWICGMQSKNGGWGAFDADNQYVYLNHIPFADHGALLDPPTADVTARCLGMLAQLGFRRDEPVVSRAIAFLKREQEADGSWFGRWGTNYIYGTWSVLSALNGIDEDPNQPYIRKAVDWLLQRQRADGGWGEDGASYWEDQKHVCKESTPSQTAWAVLALMAAGEVHSDAVQRGIQYLIDAPHEGGEWEEPWYTAVGFPRVFYLRYHGYRSYFPLWALARYRNLTSGNALTTQYGI
jgi:squalene-hopene/tetraprenyl-beta-curcumene cyclase